MTRYYLLISGVALTTALSCQARKQQDNAAPPLAEEKKALPLTAVIRQHLKLTQAERRIFRDRIEAVGSVSYDENHHAVIGPLVSGRISHIAANLGSEVKAGAALAEVESPEVGEAQSDFIAAMARAKAAKAEWHRQRELEDKQISSKRELEAAESQAISEEAGVRAASERLLGLGYTQQDLTRMLAGYSSAGRVTLRSSIDGIVIGRYITLGQAVEKATDAFRIFNPRHLWVLLDIYEKDLQRVELRQNVRLSSESHPGVELDGRVGYISNELDTTTRSAKVRIEIDNPNGILRPGQFVRARIVDSADNISKEATSVPLESVIQIDGADTVFVVAGDVARPQKVQLGQNDGSYVEIVQGIAPGETIVEKGAFVLKSEWFR